MKKSDATDHSATACGDINQTFLAIDIRSTPNGRSVGGAFINLNSRSMLVTEFLDNEHMSSLESFILQLNTSSSDSKFCVFANLPSYSQDPLLCEKIQDLLKICEVEYQTTNNNR